MVMWALFSAKNDYKIGYLTQDPDFDDNKTVLDTVLSSDLKEIQLIREYELLMLNYSEDKQARLERVMSEMDSLQAWEIESQVKTVLSKLGIQDLSNSRWSPIRWFAKTGFSWRKSFWATMIFCFLMSLPTTWILPPLSG